MKRKLVCKLKSRILHKKEASFVELMKLFCVVSPSVLLIVHNLLKKHMLGSCWVNSLFSRSIIFPLRKN